jgi:hypothetical protein
MEHTMDFSSPNWLKDYQNLIETEMAKSDALGPGVKIGRIFSIAVADGSAYYKVVKVNKRTARVKWIEELALDGYRDMILGYEGSIQLSRLEPILSYDAMLRRIMRDGKGK